MKNPTTGNPVGGKAKGRRGSCRVSQAVGDGARRLRAMIGTNKKGLSKRETLKDGDEAGGWPPSGNGLFQMR